MRILGISCFYHDSAACLIEDGRIVAAAEEERFTRRKHDSDVPEHAVRYCLEEAGIGPNDIDHVVLYEKPFLKFERILSMYTATFPRSREPFVRAMGTWLADKLWVRSRVSRRIGYKGEILFSEHHLSHAASAYYPSPFDEAAVVTADGVGEWATATVGTASGLDLQIIDEVRFPHSLGLLYSAFTAYLGFEVNEGEYKVMGLAAYGRPTRVDDIRKVLKTLADGSFALDMRYFAYHRGVQAFSRAFIDLFGPIRSAEAEFDQRHADLAASLQYCLEEAWVLMARRAREITGSENLCLAGGIALNVLANASVLRESGFKRVWVQPAAGDSGGALGAAAYLAHGILRHPERHRMTAAYLGSSFTDEEIHAVLERSAIEHERMPRADIARRVAGLIASGSVIGWFQGRMEFGPRALGSRSILADPTDPATKERVNEKIKHREAFRPFAPSVVAEAAHEYFDFEGPSAVTSSPFMLFTARVRSDKVELLPAITHVDGTARVQTVDRKDNPLYHELITEFGRIKGVPVLLNTSFNVRGEPIVRTPEEALNSFAYTDMDYLVLGDCLVPASAKRKLGDYPGRLRVKDDPEVVT